MPVGNLNRRAVVSSSNPIEPLEARRLLAVTPVYTSKTFDSSAGSSIAADFDGDGDIDFLDTPNTTGQHTITLYAQQPDHTFVAQSIGPNNQATFAAPVLAVDLNNDGHPDWVGTKQNNSTGYVSWSINNGDGTFGPIHTFQTRAAFPSPPIAADLDRDGDLDIVIGEGITRGVEALFNDGQGNLSAPTVVSGVGNDTNFSASAADIDGDGDIDLFIPTRDSASAIGVKVLLNDGHGTFTDGQFVTFPSSFTSTSVALADFDNDGDIDLLLSAYGTNAVATFYNDGTGHLGNPVVVKGASSSIAMVAADLNGDSATDVLTSAGSIILNDGSGTLSLGIGYAGNAGFYQNTQAIDVNADGKIDAVSVGSVYYGGGYTDTLAPVASRGKFIYSPQAGPPAVRVDFSEPVHSVGHATPIITLQNTTTGAAIDASKLATMSDAGDMISWLLPKNLPDGNYRFTVPATTTLDVAGNHLASDYVFNFQVLAGDANHNGTVDIVDLGSLSTNWQQTNASFAQGDFNYDGNVDIVDLGILSSNWQKSLPAPGASPVVIAPPKKVVTLPTKTIATSISPAAPAVAPATRPTQSVFQELAI